MISDISSPADVIGANGASTVATENSGRIGDWSTLCLELSLCHARVVSSCATNNLTACLSRSPFGDGQFIPLISIDRNKSLRLPTSRNATKSKIDRIIIILRQYSEYLYCLLCLVCTPVRYYNTSYIVSLSSVHIAYDIHATGTGWRPYIRQPDEEKGRFFLTYSCTTVCIRLPVPVDFLEAEATRFTVKTFLFRALLVLGVRMNT